MKKLFLIFALSLSMTVIYSCTQDIPNIEVSDDNNFYETFESSGFEREFILHLPPDYESLERMPVIVAFHGSGSTGESFQYYSGLDEHADQEGFAVVYPNSLTGQWIEGIASNSDSEDVEDVIFYNEIIDYLDDILSIDRARLFAVGHSQGGFFAHRLAIDNASYVTAYATVSSSMGVPLAERLTEPRRVPVIMFAGYQDDVILYDGDYSFGIYSYLPQSETLQKMLFNNNCGSDSTVVRIDKNSDDNAAVHVAFQNQAGVSVVELYSHENSGHDWYKIDVNVPETIVEFFTRF